MHANSARLDHNVIDATCPLVTKVHVQARRYADDGYTVILIGHEGHEEVVGTMGEAPEATILVQDVTEAEVGILKREISFLNAVIVWLKSGRQTGAAPTG